MHRRRKRAVGSRVDPSPRGQELQELWQLQIRRDTQHVPAGEELFSVSNVRQWFALLTKSSSI